MVFAEEGVGPFRAIGRSWRIMGSKVGRRFISGYGDRALIAGVLGVLVEFGCIYAALGAGFAALATEAGPGAHWTAIVVASAVAALIETLILPFPTVSIILIYFDHKVRAEAWDLTLAAEAMGREGAERE